LEEDSLPNSTGTYPSKAVYTEKCIACGNCYEVCPDVCINIYELTGAETAAGAAGAISAGGGL
jgi:2-oxoglutarate ferredoxin oxidoreductase subunit delta